MKVWLRTFGCRANQADTEAVRGMLLAAGHTVVGATNPVVVVFPTLPVTATSGVSNVFLWSSASLRSSAMASSTRMYRSPRATRASSTKAWDAPRSSASAA
jgi:hypothetical protein